MSEEDRDNIISYCTNCGSEVPSGQAFCDESCEEAFYIEYDEDEEC